MPKSPLLPFYSFLISFYLLACSWTSMKLIIRGGHLSVKTDPPDKSGQPDNLPARPRTLIRMDTVQDIYFFSQVVTRLARPNQYTKFSHLSDPLFLSFTFCFLTLSPQSQLTAHRRLTLSFSLLHYQLSPSLSSSRAHNNFFTSTIKLSLLSLGVCLGKNSLSRGGSRSNKISSDWQGSQQIQQDLTGSGEIQRDPCQSGEISSVQRDPQRILVRSRRFLPRHHHLLQPKKTQPTQS